MKITFISLFVLLAFSSSTCKKAVNNDEFTLSPVPETVTYRPAFHFAPLKNWHNDPNGLVFYKDNYHLFFQYNPYQDKFGHLSWGHATSTDLMKWREEPVAIYEYPEADGSMTMAFSGTAVVDSMNTSGFGTASHPVPLVAVYTSATSSLQHQSLAYSVDGLNFTRYQANPVLNVNSKDFRDPKVFWHQGSGKWVMIMSKALEYKLELYSSNDLKTWTYMSSFGGTGNMTKIWECPDLFQLPVENEEGVKKWVITVSAGHPQNGYLAMQYFIGEFDGTTFKADELNYPLYLDEGKDFYAGIIYNNLPSNDTRKIMIAWCNSWEYATDIPTVGFRGSMAIPRHLTLHKKDEGYFLKQAPINELENYVGDVLFEKPELAVEGSSATGIASDVFDMQLTLSRGNFAKAGVRILKNENEETVIYFVPQNNTLYLDRTKSGNVNFNSRFSSIESVTLPDEGSEVQIRVLVDKSIVEVFVNGGEKVITDRVFPYKKNGTVEFFSEGGPAPFKAVKIRKVNPSMNP